MALRWLRKLRSDTGRVLPAGDLGAMELYGTPTGGTYHFERAEE